MTTELSRYGTADFFYTMFKQLRDVSHMLAFIQAHGSVELFMRNMCAFTLTKHYLDLERIARHTTWVNMGKQYKGKTVDVSIYHLGTKAQESEPSQQFEFHIARPGDLDVNSDAIRKGIDSFNRQKNAWVMVLFLHFDNTEPDQSADRIFPSELAHLIELVDSGQPLASPALSISAPHAKGNACLLAWPAFTSFAKQKCSIHNIELIPDEVSIEYGLIRFNKQYVSAREQLFRNAFSSVRGGCCDGELGRTAVVRFCPQCRAEEKAWLALNNKTDYSAPKRSKFQT